MLKTTNSKILGYVYVSEIGYIHVFEQKQMEFWTCLLIY